jgi:LDH2 family malate/lactate/ureidoglycolate dehydrogenase
MLPIGTHKGSAISTINELRAVAIIVDLTSVAAFNAVGTTVLAPRHGELNLAFDPDYFGNESTTNSAKTPLEDIEESGARLPSQHRFASRATSMKRGIQIPTDQLGQLQRYLDLWLDGLF